MGFRPFRLAMELRQLRYFAMVATERSFTRAAERLNMAQPPLSRQIQQLEDEIGVLLIRRGIRPLELTEAGRFLFDLFDQAQQLLAKVGEIKAGARRIGDARKRFFAIGFVGSTLYGPLPMAIRRFRDGFPEVEIGLSELTTHQQIEELKSRRIDIGFGRLVTADDPAIARETLVEEALALAVSRDHPWAREKAAWLKDLARQPFIIYPGRPRPSFADQVLAIFKRAELSPPIVQEAHDIQTAIGLVAAGIGVTLVPASVARLRGEDVVYIPMADADLRTPVIISYRADDSSDLLSKFIAFARP
jgi:DNA-binding transcriptional LysR family regulator